MGDIPLHRCNRHGQLVRPEAALRAAFQRSKCQAWCTRSGGVAVGLASPGRQETTQERTEGGQTACCNAQAGFDIGPHGDVDGSVEEVVDLGKGLDPGDTDDDCC